MTLVPRRRVSDGPSRVDTVGPDRRDSASSALGFDTSSKSQPLASIHRLTGWSGGERGGVGRVV